MRHITLITTGGTIEKTYDERTGSLANTRSIVHTMLSNLRLENTDVKVIELMSKDSLEMTDDDRARIEGAVRLAGGSASAPTEMCGVVVLHGTDTLEQTGRYLHKVIDDPRVPIILTGAMRPYEMARTDAMQNLVEALYATGVVEPGVYCSAHGRLLPFPDVTKDLERGTFVRCELGKEC